MMYHGMISTIGGENDGKLIELGVFTCLPDIVAAVERRGLLREEVVRVELPEDERIYLHVHAHGSDDGILQPGEKLDKETFWQHGDTDVVWELDAEHPDIRTMKLPRPDWRVKDEDEG